MFAALWASGHPGLYALWLVSMMTVLQVLLRVRGIAEHAGFERAEDQRLCTRTVVNPVQTFFFAPHRVNFHVEHHLYPSVPAYRLPAVHRAAAGAGRSPGSAGARRLRERAPRGDAALSRATLSVP